MNKPIITTKGTNKLSKMSAVISGMTSVVGFPIAILVIIYNALAPYPEYLWDNILGERIGVLVIVAVVWLLMVFWSAYQFVTCYSYVDVYEDRVEGKGIQNIYQLHDFKLNYDQITSVTCMGLNLYINTPSGKYRILTDVKKAKEVFDYYHNRT